MTMARYFSIKRFLILCRNEILINYKKILISAGAVIGLLLIISISSALSARLWNFHIIFYPLVLLIGGFINTSFAFNEIHNKGKNLLYLTLPASNMEKYISKYIVTSIGYILLSLIFYFLFSLIALAISLPFFSISHGLFNPLNNFIWNPIVIIYVMIHPLILFASVYFKKFALPKLILAICILGLILSFFGLIIYRIVFFDAFNGFLIKSFIIFDHISIQKWAWLETLWFPFLIILSIYFFLLGYLRFKESEV